MLIAPVIGQGDETSRDRRALLFDDFSYTSLEAFIGNEWVARTSKGWPGVEGAIWEGALSFVDDESRPGNRVLRMTASTDGTHYAAGAILPPAQILRRYVRGACALSRIVRSSDPMATRSSKRSTRSTPLKAPLDPDYSEQDFEYLPNGGWDGRATHAIQHDLGNVSTRARMVAVNDSHVATRQPAWLAHAGAADWRTAK